MKKLKEKLFINNEADKIYYFDSTYDAKQFIKNNIFNKSGLRLSVVTDEEGFTWYIFCDAAVTDHYKLISDIEEELGTLHSSKDYSIGYPDLRTFINKEDYVHETLLTVREFRDYIGDEVLDYTDNIICNPVFKYNNFMILNSRWIRSADELRFLARDPVIDLLGRPEQILIQTFTGE